MNYRLIVTAMLAVLVSFTCRTAAKTPDWVTISNGEMWKDTNGNEVQAHGAGFLQVGDTWYMIGEDRSDPWHPDVNMYSSKDLVNWTFERKIIENGVTHPELGKTRMIERPKLMYCAKTGKYVVWCHWESSNYGASEAGVFYCDSVNGAYKFHWGGRPLGVKSRDCNVFVDDDGTAYFISTIDENRHLGLFKLSDDYLSAVEYTELFKWKSREAPAIVKVDGMYYMLSSACTGWAPNPCKLACSTSLTSGWSELKELGNKIAFDTQAASILTIKGSKETSYLYVGDRWQDPTLPESKTIIFPIDFANGNCEFDYARRFDINFKTGVCRASTKQPKEVAGKCQKIVENTPNQRITDLGKSRRLSGFAVTPHDNADLKQIVRKYEFYVSADGRDWDLVSSGDWLPYRTEVFFTPRKARFVKFVSPDGKQSSVSELDLFSSRN